MKLGLMIPLRRCGSNAIRLRLSSNPHLFCPYPCHLTDLNEKKYGDLNKDENYFSLIVDVIHLQSTSLMPWKGIPVFDPNEVFQSIKNKEPRSKTLVYTELLKKAGEQKRASFVLDKSQDSVCDWKEWLALNPDIKFLDVVRNPKAQISSMNQAVIYDYETTLNTLRWVKARRYVDEIYECCPQQILTIRFEDFISDEEKTLEKISNFFGVPYLNTDITRLEEAKQMAERSPLWESNFSPPDATVFEKYKTRLSQSEIEHIEAVTYPYMKKYGYARETVGRNLLNYSLEEVKRRNEQNREKIWAELKQNHPFDFILRQKRKYLLNP